MAAEIDPVVLELRAEVGKYRADLKSTTSLVSQSLGQQEKSVQRLEAQMRRSSGAIGGQIKGLAAAFAGAFTGRELVGLIDGFTRLQNSLRVAGLEGQNLERVQSQLLELSSKYGVGIEGLADLFGKATDAGRSFGASQDQVVKLTEATAQALKITGTSAAQAQGAILGLSQALASGTVRAEEYNQINEGGLRPLLQAAAATAKYGGDINKLRSDILAGKVASQELFSLIEEGSKILNERASKATLTLAGAVEALTSRLTVYVGSASSAQGVTGALAGAISALADNLDVVIPALAVLATALGVGFVTNAIAARVAALSAAAATGTLAASATFAGRALLAAFGGPIGLAITGLAVGLAYVASNTRDASAAAREAEIQSKRTEAALSAETAATNALSKAKGREREAMLASLAASRARAQQALQTAQALRAEALAALAIAKAEQTKQRGLLDSARMAPSLGATEGGARILYGTTPLDKGVSKAQAELDRADNNIAALTGAIEGIGNAIDAAGKPIKLPTVGDGKKPKGGSGGSSATDRAAQAEARAAQDLNNLQIEELRARAQLVTNAEDRADIERQILGKERDAREADIAAAVKSGDLTAEQAQAQRDILDLLYGKRQSEAKDGEILVESTKSLYGIAIERERQSQLAAQQADAMRDELDLLSAQANATDVRQERVAIERRMLEIQQKIERALLEEAIARGDVLDAAQARARLEQRQSIERASFDRASGGPLDQYLIDLQKAGANVNDQFQQIAVDGLQSFTDGITDAIVNAKNLGDVFKNVAKQIIADLIRIAIQQQIVNALQSTLFSFGGLFSSASAGVGSAGSALGSAIGRLPGRASGGAVEAGRLYRINESGVEGFVPATSGKIIPAGQMNAIAARGGASDAKIVTVRLDLSGDIDARIQQQSAGVAIEVVRSSAPAIVDAGANEALRRANRPKV